MADSHSETKVHAPQQRDIQQQHVRNANAWQAPKLSRLVLQGLTALSSCGTPEVQQDNL